ncbi:hypothetical protein QQX98_007294 [Neonectria punicea]|uniref:NACHT domain-containing protein n=1 Tax=Neonectria punicea TaxID=979145 RepID=A0ABR1GY89_9HYPO
MPRAPVVSALARQTIRTAFDELNRTISPGDSRDFVHITLPDVKKAALDIENELAARQSLRYMRRLMPLFKGLEHYSKVVDILCNGTPYLPWIWALISLILRVASEYVEAFEQIIKGYAGIASSLSRFETLSATFTSWKLLFLTSWGRFQRRFDNVLEDLKNHGTLVDNEASAIHISEAQKMRQDIRTWREESLDQVRKFEEEQTARQHEFITSWLNIDESDQLAIFDAILAEGAEYPGTCDWILRNPKVKSWCQSKPDTAILWLQGTPGSGKSVLATQLVNFMKAAKLFVIRHFCTYLYASSTMYEQILRSLLIQLLRKDDDLIAHVYGECVLGKKSPTTAVLEQLLQTMLKSMSTEPSQSEYIWIIIDGLDECEPDKQIRLVNLINQITKTSVPGSITCKVLISSRSPSVSLNRLRRRQIISLTDEKDSVQGAIRQYLEQRLQSLHEKISQHDVGQDEILEIQNTIATKTDGMFLYARLVLDYLSHNIFYSCDEIQASVNQLPEKLTDFYRKILTQILVTLDPRSVSRIKSVLGWVAFARRPLRKMELLSAISFSAGDPTITHVAPRYILDLCGSLVEERQDATLAFIHISVKDGLDATSTPFVLACQLAEELDEAYGSSSLGESVSKVRISDERLALLQQHPVLHKHVEEALKSRAIKDIDPNLLQPHSPDETNQAHSNPRSAVDSSQTQVKASKIRKQHGQEQRAHHQQLAQQQTHTTIGLELDGTPNKDQKPQEAVPAMGVIDSKQDHAPITQLRQQQQQMGGNLQIQTQARDLYQKIQNLAVKHGGLERIPPEVIEKVAQTSMAQATHLFQQEDLAQRRELQRQLQLQQRIGALVQTQIHNQAGPFYGEKLQSLASEHGGLERVPPKVKQMAEQNSTALAVQLFKRDLSLCKAQLQQLLKLPMPLTVQQQIEQMPPSIRECLGGALELRSAVAQGDLGILMRLQRNLSSFGSIGKLDVKSMEIEYFQKLSHHPKSKYGALENALPLVGRLRQLSLQAAVEFVENLQKPIPYLLSVT